MYAIAPPPAVAWQASVVTTPTLAAVPRLQPGTRGIYVIAGLTLEGRIGCYVGLADGDPGRPAASYREHVLKRKELVNTKVAVFRAPPGISGDVLLVIEALMIRLLYMAGIEMINFQAAAAAASGRLNHGRTTACICEVTARSLVARVLAGVFGGRVNEGFVDSRSNREAAAFVLRLVRAASVGMLVDDLHRFGHSVGGLTPTQTLARDLRYTETATCGRPRIGRTVVDRVVVYYAAGLSPHDARAAYRARLEALDASE